jgi:hypothetical protein
MQQQTRRIIHSNALRNSLTLQNLLQFLVTRTTDGNPDGLKEYTIGVEAFGRKPDFDPKTDTIVRVQTHRLRQKLKEYYQEEGIADPILVEIPKGHYCPTFRLRTDPSEPSAENDELIDLEAIPASLQAQTSEPAAAGAIQQPVPAPLRHSLLRILGITTLVVLGAVAGFFVGRARTQMEGGNSASTASPQALASSGPVRAFWASVLNNDPSPIIAYPNAVFLLDDSNDLFRFRQGASDNRGARVEAHLAHQYASNPALVASAGPLYYEDGYTGTGELESVAMLTELFAEMGLKPTIKTSRNITPEDLRQHTVILLGSPFQNIAVAQLMAAGDFAFQNPDAHREQWRAQILNAHPEANESAAYHTERVPDTQVLKMDYSLISIQPGVVEGRNIAVIGGLDTKGTEGATRFITSRSGVESLSTALAAKKLTLPGAGSSSKNPMPWFQALVLVHLEKGDQVLSTELASVHPFPPKK